MIVNSIVFDYLDSLFEDPKCELLYNKDYEFLIAVMLSAQTTDKRVNEVTPFLFDKYNSLEKLANASLNDIEDIIKRIGTYRKKALFVIEIAKKIVENNFVLPNDRKFLESLPGVGRKTTNVFLSEIYKEEWIAVDTHVKRVSYRLGFSKKSDNELQVEKKLMKKIPKGRWRKTHHQLVLFGRYYCKAINPLCSECGLKDVCLYNKK